MQNPETQQVTDSVWHELAFAGESRGWSRDKIRRRVSETASYFALEELFRRETAFLSGGQKQLVNLAAATVTGSELLILDEPTAQLDPLGAQRFTDMLKKMHSDLGLTVILCEHNTENIFAYADRVAYMEDGRIKKVCPPEKLAFGNGDNKVMLGGLPCGARIAAALGCKDKLPLTLMEGRSFIYGYKNTVRSLPEKKLPSGDMVMELKNVDFRYEREGTQVLRGVSLKVRRGEILSVIGSNGCGKSTLLSVMSGLLSPQFGEIKYKGRPLRFYKKELYRGNIALLPQNPQNCFVKETLREDWRQMADICSAGDFSPLAEEMGLSSLMESHPYDLSGGEQQRAALGKILMQRPSLLLLDEPCKGLDAVNRERFKKIIFRLAEKGTAIVMVTHDLELAAETSHSCAFLFDGEIVSRGTPSELFSENVYCTTAASKLSRGYFQRCVTAEDVVRLCEINGEKNEE